MSESESFHFDFINFSFASLESLEDLINLIIGSMLLFATTNPIKTCALLRDLFKLKIILFVTTSSRKSIKEEIISFKFICSGLPPLSASILELKVV